MSWQRRESREETAVTGHILDYPTPSIPACVNVITLGVRDFAAKRDFYRALGWSLAVDEGDFAAFAMRGAVLALFPLDKLAADGNAEAARPVLGVRFTIGILVDQPEQVDATIAAVRKAGGRVTKPPVDAEFFEGRSAYFADPEDNFWEVAWAPPSNGVVMAARLAMGVSD
jgi:catechol 2,3-dioxygenase-like lactoylglutathione lyase family enzyme